MSKFSGDEGQKEVVKIKRSRALTVGAVIALLGAIYAVWVFLGNKDILVINEDLQISMIGTIEDYKGKTKMHYENGAMQFENGTTKLTLQGVPVYYKDQDKVILTKSMIFTNYDTSTLNRVSYLTTLQKNDNVFEITIEKNKERTVSGGYLFDGKNTYLFLDPVTVTWNDMVLELAPLSYIYVANKQCFYYYSSDTKEADYIEIESGAVLAEEQTGKYVLNLSQDMVDLPNGKSLLLMSNPEAIDLMK